MNIYEKVARTDGLVTDVDGVRHPVIPRLKLPLDFLSYSVKSIAEGNFHAPAIYVSLWASKTKSRKEISDFEHSVYSAIVKNSREAEFRSAGKEFSSNRTIEGYPDLVDAFMINDRPVIACSRNPAAEYMTKATDFVTNKFIFKNGVFKGIDMKILNGEDKRNYVDEYIKEKYDSSLKRFTYLGDACTDIPAGLESDVFLLSPNASKKLRKKVGRKGYQIRDYKQFARRLDEEMSKPVFANSKLKKLQQEMQVVL
jgi:phosphoserine phosphatase